MQEPNNPKRKVVSSTVFQWKRWMIGASVCLLMSGGYVYLNRESPNAQLSAQKRPPSVPGIPIDVATVKKSDFSVYFTGLGTVIPLNTVTVKSRVDGELIRVLFKEGQVVSSGELLAEIDPRPFQVQLTEAEGALAHDQALLQNAKLDLERYKDLVKKDLIPKQQLDTQEALVRQYEGSLKADQGQIDNARLQLVYSRITAPSGGRIGLRQVDPGNIVHASDTNGIAVITQMQPISIIFSLPEDSLSQILGKLRGGGRLTVEAYDREQQHKIGTGILLTVDNQIDPTTGTVKFRAEFPNQNYDLFPNQFVNARLIIEVKHDALVVPSPAIQRGPQGTFVYVVKDDQTAELRSVTVGMIQEGNASILTGLSSGDLVVVDGADRLRNGSKVEVKGPNNAASAPQRQLK